MQKHALCQPQRRADCWLTKGEDRRAIAVFKGRERDASIIVLDHGQEAGAEPSVATSDNDGVRRGSRGRCRTVFLRRSSFFMEWLVADHGESRGQKRLEKDAHAQLTAVNLARIET